MVSSISLAGALLCLCLLSTAFAAEKNYNICHEEFWKEDTVEKVASIPNPDHTCSDRKTPLIFAAKYGKPDIINALKEAGAKK